MFGNLSSLIDCDDTPVINQQVGFLHLAALHDQRASADE